MFLSTMTADAASQHGRELSNSPTSSSLFPPFATFPRSTLNALLGFGPRQKTPAPQPQSSFDQSPSNGDSLVVSVAGGKKVQTADESRPSSSKDSVESNSQETNIRKRTVRPKTTYTLCHPPPSNRQKTKLRPKVLLQLQQISQASRPKPVLEVVPSLRYAPKHLSKLNRCFRAIDRLGPDDVVILTAAHYMRNADVDSSDEDPHDTREMIGAIRVETSKEDKQTLNTEIFMDDGLVWRATAAANGSYEFVTVDEHGLQIKARWVARPVHKRKASSADVRSIRSGISGMGMGGLNEEKKFTFSTIRAESRRHPIIATMTRTTVEVVDQYTIPPNLPERSGSLNTAPTTPALETPSGHSESESYLDSRKNEGTPIQTDEALRKLILVTGIWVGFREGWSAAFGYSTPGTPSTPSHLDSSFGRQFAGQRAVSMPPLDLKHISRSSTPEDGRRAIPKMLRSGPYRIKRTATGTPVSSPALVPSAPVSPVGSPVTRGRRSNSIDTGRMKRSSTINWHSFRHDSNFLESPREVEPDRRHTTDLSQESSALASIIPITPTDTVHVPDVRIDGAAIDQGYAEKERPRVQSAYIPVESTRGLWGSGDADSVPGARTPRKRDSKIQHEPLGPIKVDKSKGKFRRFIALFRRGD